MPQPISLLYGSPTSVTCTLSGLTTGSAQQSTAISNTTDLFIDMGIELKLVFPNNTPTGNCTVYVATSVDGTNFDGNATGTDGTYNYGTFGSNLWQVFSMVPAQNDTLRETQSLVYEIGWVPPNFSLIVSNNTGFTLSAGSALRYIGVKAQFG